MHSAPKSLVVSLLVLSSSALAQSQSEAKAALQQAQEHFRACRNGRLQLEFAPTLARLETSRRSLEKGRRELESARRSLEVKRKRIEAGHQLRHATAAEREAKEQHYVQTLARDYTEPMQALEPLAKQYAAGIRGYADVIEEYASFCSRAAITTASARAFVEKLAPTVDAIGTTAQSFVADASKAAAGDVAAR